MNEDPATTLPANASPARRGASGLWAFLVRWQEYAGWLPLCLALFVLGFLFFGALDRSAATDTMPIAAVLPLKIAYAIAAGGVAFLIRRRWRFKLDKAEQAQLWTLLLNTGIRIDRFADGNWSVRVECGAALIFLADLVLTLCVLRWLFAFFSLPS